MAVLRGRGYRLDPASPLATAEWLVIGDAQGEAKGARIMAALALDEADITRWLPHRLEARHALTWNEAEARVEARLERRLGAIVLARVPDPSPDPDAVSALLLDQVRRSGLGLLPLGRGQGAARTRAMPGWRRSRKRPCWTGWTNGSGRCWREGATFPSRRASCTMRWLNRLDWNERQTLDRLAPAGIARQPEPATPSITRTRAARPWNCGCRHCSGWTGIP
jgi:ATP-dependent helicase HrpB